jgi:hypothetical protein
VSIKRPANAPATTDHFLSRKAPEIITEEVKIPNIQNAIKSGLKSNIPPANRNGVPSASSIPKHMKADGESCVIDLTPL